MQNGVVKFFNKDKGFGFVQPDTGGKDVFVHISSLKKAGIATLDEGDKVEFDTAEDRRTGKLAIDEIRLL